MAKKTFYGEVKQIGNDLTVDITDLIKKGGLEAKTGDKVLLTRISPGGMTVTVGEPLTKEMKKEEYIMSSAKLSTTSVVEEVFKYVNGKKVRNKAMASSKIIVFRKTPLSSFYKIAKEHFHISDRMIRRYISRELMPPPERYGKKAFYDEARSNVFSYLNVIKTLQKCYNISLDEIEVIINRYRGQIIDLDFILADIEDKYNNPKRRSPYYVGIRKCFLKKIQKKSICLKKVDIKSMEKEIKSKQA
jgi:DNA-binding transcriptional MerR regulator